jgi:murein DD-endopeptidase / murein LD-carboxypeptidase
LYLRFKPQSLRMQNLFFVSVAIGIFSGTSITAKAQSSVNMEQVNTAVPAKSSTKFIEGIEIKAGTNVAVEPSNVKNTEIIASPGSAVNNETADIEKCTSIQFKYAQLLNMDVESITNHALYDFIEKWWATPYRYGGATQKGIDCSAYSGTLLHEVYGFVASRTSREQYKACEKIDKENLQEGDLVFFNTRRGVSHVGVYLRNGYFTHASTGNGVTISSLDEPYYNKKYIGGGRIVVKPAEE